MTAFQFPLLDEFLSVSYVLILTRPTLIFQWVSVSLILSQRATPYLASVRIYNADASTEEEVGIPVKGAKFYVAYEGLSIITLSNRVKIWGEGGIRDLTDEDLQE